MYYGDLEDTHIKQVLDTRSKMFPRHLFARHRPSIKT